MKTVKLKVNLDVDLPDGKTFSICEAQNIDLNSSELESYPLTVAHWIEYAVQKALQPWLTAEAKMEEYRSKK